MMLVLDQLHTYLIEAAAAKRGAAAKKPAKTAVSDLAKPVKTYNLNSIAKGDKVRVLINARRFAAVVDKVKRTTRKVTVSRGGKRVTEDKVSLKVDLTLGSGRKVQDVAVTKDSLVIVEKAPKVKTPTNNPVKTTTRVKTTSPSAPTVKTPKTTEPAPTQQSKTGKMQPAKREAVLFALNDIFDSTPVSYVNNYLRNNFVIEPYQGENVSGVSTVVVRTNLQHIEMDTVRKIIDGIEVRFQHYRPPILSAGNVGVVLMLTVSGVKPKH